MQDRQFTKAQGEAPGKCQYRVFQQEIFAPAAVAHVNGKASLIKLQNQAATRHQSTLIDEKLKKYMREAEILMKLCHVGQTQISSGGSGMLNEV